MKKSRSSSQVRKITDLSIIEAQQYSDTSTAPLVIWHQLLYWLVETLSHEVHHKQIANESRAAAKGHTKLHRHQWRGGSVGPKIENFTHVLEYKCTTGAYHSGDFYQILSFVDSFMDRHALKFGHTHSSGLGAMGFKFRYPLAAKLCIKFEYIFEVQEWYGPPLSPCLVWTLYAMGDEKGFCFVCLSTMLSNYKVCECHFDINTLKQRNNLDIIG